MKTGIELIAEERQRQIEAEGYTKEHDDNHDGCDLYHAGMAYWETAQFGKPSNFYFPWKSEYWKPTNPERDRVKAGALIQAEIDRLERIKIKIAAEIDRLQTMD